MSKWFDQSNNANKLRQSYLKGFLDISGGGVLVRSDNSLNFYTTANETVPQFAMDATKIRVMNPANNQNAYGTPGFQATGATDISAQKLAYLNTLTENVQTTLDEFHTWKNASTTGISSSTVDASNVTVAADASIGGRLYVGGDITANGNLTLAKDLYVGGNVVVAGSQTVNMDFYVKGNTHLDGNVYAGSNFYLYNGSAFVNENITASGELTVVGKSYLLGDVSMNGDLRVANTIYCNKIVVANDVSDNGTMEVAMDAEMQSRLFVLGDASLNSKLFVNGDASLNATLRLGGDASLNSKLFVNGDASLNSSLRLGGDASLNSKLFVAGDASLNATLTLGGAAALKSTLEVTGATTLKSSVEVTGETTLKAKAEAQKDLKVNERLFVLGDASLNSKLFVNGETTLQSKLIAMADASLNAKLSVAGDASFNSHVYARDVSAAIFQAGRLIFEDNANGTGNMPNTIRSTEGNITIRPNSTSDWTVITSNLKVDGEINFTGSMVRTDTIVKVTEAFDVTNSGTRTALVVSQEAAGQNIAVFDNGSELTPTLVVGHDKCVSINKDITDVNRHLDVSGNGYFSGIFEVAGAVTFGNAVTVTGDYSSTAGNLTLTGGKLTTNTLEVTTTSEFKGDVTMRSHLKMDASKFIDQMGTEGW
jgi:cytoskeletal protein CcmA (bactofilin family)